MLQGIIRWVEKKIQIFNSKTEMTKKEADDLRIQLEPFCFDTPRRKRSGFYYEFSNEGMRRRKR